MSVKAPSSRLRLDALAVAIAGRCLMRGVELSLNSGESVALLGPSGCGKTTLLRTVAGLCPFASGRVSLDGRTPEQVGWPRWRRRVVYLQQRPVLFVADVRENLRRSFTYATARRAWPENEACALIERLGLPASTLDASARSLSGGEQQRVSFARALLLRPDVLLLDEPTHSLDEETRDALEGLVREEAQRRGLISVVVTHERRQAERWGGRTLELTPHLQNEGRAP